MRRLPKPAVALLSVVLIALASDGSRAAQFALTATETGSQVTLAIEAVTVIDPTAATPEAARLPDRTVLITGNRIERVGPAATTPVPDGVVRIDGRGRFLLPGFWDMHVHFNRDEATQLRVMAPLMIAHGITSVRDLLGDCWEPCGFGRRTLAQMRDLQRRIADGEVLAPRLQALSSPLVHGPTSRSGYPREFPQYWQPGTAEQGREVARFLAARGVDFVKPYHTLPREAYLGLLEESNALRLPVSGHLPWSVHPAEAAAAGVRTIEHARWPVMACNAEYESFRNMYASINAQAGEFDSEVFGRFRDAVVTQFDEQLCGEIVRALAANNVYLVPTHLTREMDARADEPAYRDDPRRRFVPPARLRGWDNDLNATANSPVEFHRMYDGVFDLGLRVTGMAHRAGVKILVGTDAFDTMVFPGFSYHDELQHLRRAGLTPLAILRAATYQGAEFLGLTEAFGSVAPGQIADLVLLEADPLADIASTTRIAAVVFDGRVHDRSALDSMIRNVETYAGGMR